MGSRLLAVAHGPTDASYAGRFALPGDELRDAAGVPTLQYGPGRVEQAHAVDESVEISDVLACARVYALLALRACTTEEVTGE